MTPSLRVMVPLKVSPLRKRTPSPLLSVRLLTLPSVLIGELAEVPLFQSLPALDTY